MARCVSTRQLIEAWLPKAVADLTARLTDTDLDVSYETSIVAGSGPQLAEAVHGALARMCICFKLEVKLDRPVSARGPASSRRQGSLVPAAGPRGPTASASQELPKLIDI